MQFCKLCLSTGLEQATQMLINVYIILKSVHTMRVCTNETVAISKATLHFRKVTKDFKQNRVDDGNEKVKQ